MVAELVPLPGPPPAREQLLALLDELRGQVERGEIQSMIVIPVAPNRDFAVISRGKIRALELSGLLLRATLDASNLTNR